MTTRKGTALGTIMVIGVIIIVALALGGPWPILQQTEEEGYKVIWSGKPAAAEADPGSGETGWLATWWTDLSVDEGTVFANNATDWSTDSDSWGYADSDNWDLDMKAGDPANLVCRVRFNKDHAYNDALTQFEDSRCRCKITVSGSITISNTSGTAVVSQNSSSDDFIWINFYWDNAGSGYQMPLDGTITVEEICIEAKF